MFGRLLRSVMPGRPRTPGETFAAARVLLERGGILWGYAAPFAILRGDGSVMAANEVALKAGAIFRRTGDVWPCLAEALSTGRTTHGAIMTGSVADPGNVWEVTVVPYGGDSALVLSHDATHDRALRAALVDSRRRYKDLVEISSDFAWETNAAGEFIFVSPAGALGREADEYLGRPSQVFLVDSQSAETVTPFAARSPVSRVDSWMRHADGRSVLIRTSAVPVFDAAGTWSGARGICRDVTADRERDAALAAAQSREKLTAYIIRAMHDPIDPRQILLAAASALARAVGGAGCCVYRSRNGGGFELAADFGNLPNIEAVEKRLLPGAASSGQIIADADAAGRYLCVATSYRKETNGAVMLARPPEADAWSADERSLVADIALQLAVAIEQLEYHDRLEALSRTDEMTGLLNRRAFFAELEARISRIESGTSPGSLFFVDLDNFKLVNDVHGHKRGDEALIAVSEILTGRTRPGDLVARLGGDEFALWLDRTDKASAIQRANDLLDHSRDLCRFSGAPDRPLGISVGIAVYRPETPETIAGLIARADAAMYEIKHGTKGGYVLAPQFGERAAPTPEGPTESRAGVEA